MCDCKREWRNIETAPKDGTDILVCCGPPSDPMWGVAYWDSGLGIESGWMVWHSDDRRHHWPTHWLPLPLPPEAATSAREAAPAIDVAQTPQTPASEARNRPSGDCNAEGMAEA